MKWHGNSMIQLAPCDVMGLGVSLGFFFDIQRASQYALPSPGRYLPLFINIIFVHASRLGLYFPLFLSLIFVAGSEVNTGAMPQVLSNYPHYQRWDEDCHQTPPPR